MRALIYLRDFFVMVGVIAIISWSIDGYHALAHGSVKQKDLFDWRVVGKYPSPQGTAIVIIEYGTPNTDVKTAPFYRVNVQTSADSDKWLNHWQVWEAQVSESPNIQWLDDVNFEIKHSDSTVYEYVPFVNLNSITYGVRLDVWRR